MSVRNRKATLWVAGALCAAFVLLLLPGRVFATESGGRTEGTAQCECGVEHDAVCEEEAEVIAPNAATTPAKVTEATARERLNAVVNALKNTYFTTTGSTCNTPWESGHGCSKDNVTNVVKSNTSIKSKLGIVPDFSVVKLKHYNGNGTLNGQNGYSCYGFANFAAWYCYAQKATDQVNFNKFYTGKDTKAQMAKAKPGDIIRTTAGHSMVFIQNQSNGTQYQVLDCNWNSSSSEGNCKVRVHNISYGNYSITISRASNFIDQVNLNTYLNYSGRNYLHGTDFTSLNPDHLFSRDTSVSTVSIDSQTTHNGYNSLKITNISAGEPGKDLAIRTATSGRQADGWVADSKEMILSFCAKASTAGTKMYFRWGYEAYSAYRPVTLSTSWEWYAIRMDKTVECNGWMNPYIDSAGTVWITEMQLEDGSSSYHNFTAENSGAYQTVTQTVGQKYTLPETPTRTGYIFDGWYTAAEGGTQITSDTAVKSGHLNVYAHWIPATYTVYFDANGGSCTPTSKTVTYADYYYSLPNPTRTGYTFDGWYTSPVGGSYVYYVTTVTTPSDHTLYAHWTQTSAIVESCSLELEGKLGIRLNLRVPESAAKAVLRFQGEFPESVNWTLTRDAAHGYNSATGQFTLVYGKIAAKEMTCPLTVTVYDIYGDIVGMTKTTSIGEISGTSYSCCVADWASYAAKISSHQKTVNLAKALLAYGGAAQAYFKFNLSNPINPKGYFASEIESVQTDPAMDGTIPSNAKTKLDYKSMALNLEGDTELQLKFGKKVKATDGTGKALSVVASGSTYYVSIPGIAAVDLDKIMTVKVTYGTATCTFKVAALTYANKAIAGSSNTNLVKTMKALYLYNQMAEAYFNNAD